MPGPKVDRNSARKRRGARTMASKHLAPTTDLRHLDPFGQIQMQGDFVRASKRRLSDRSPRVRWAARIVVLAMFGPTVIFIAVAIIGLIVERVAG